MLTPLLLEQFIIFSQAEEEYLRYHRIAVCLLLKDTLSLFY